MEKQYEWEELIENDKTSILIDNHRILMPERCIDIEKVMNYLIEYCCFVGLPKEYKHNQESFIYDGGVFNLGNVKFYPRFEVNDHRDIQLHSTPQSEMPGFINQELKLIRKKLDAFAKAPYSYFIKESLKRHKYYRKDFFDVNEYISLGAKEFNLWWLYILWKFSWLLLIYEPDKFDALLYKIVANEKAKKKWQILSIAVADITGTPHKDEVFKDIRQIFELLIEHQILSEFNYCLKLDAGFSYENFIKGNIPKEDQVNQITGFNTKLNETKISKLFKALKDENYIDCIEDDFKSIFTRNPKPIKWIDTSITHPTIPNKQTIFELFYLLFESRLITKPDLEHSNGNNFYRKLEYIFPDVKNFANSAGSGKSKQKTEREKMLKHIIDAIVS